MRIVGDLAARLTGNIRDFSVKMDQAAARLDRLGASAKAAGAKMQSLGAGLTKSVTAPLVAVGGAALYAASGFEDAFVGLKKNLRDVDSATIEKLRSEIRGLAKEIPVTAAELSTIAATSAQLGIKTENLIDFTKNLAAMADSADDLDFQSAARGIASFGNVMGTAQSKLKNVMSAITLLGSTTNTTEGQVLSMANRFTGAARSAGITEAQVLGLAASLSAVGLSAELGGGNFAKILTMMNSKVKQAGKGMADLATVSGMSASAFKKQWETDATGALIAFVRGLKGLGERGGDVAGLLDKMGFSGTEMARVFTAMTFAVDDMTTTLATANQGFDEGNAHLKEAAERWATFSKQLKLVLNQLTDVGIELGGELIKVLKDMLPALKLVIDAMTGMVKAFGALPGPVKTAVIALGGMALAAGPVLFALGGIAQGIAALSGGGVIITTVASAFGTLKLAMLPFLAMIGPGGWMLVGLAALFAYLAYKIPQGLGKAARAIKGSSEEMLGRMAKLTGDRDALAERLSGTTDRRMQGRIKDLIADLDERIANARKVIDQRTVGQGSEVFGPEPAPKPVPTPTPFDPSGIGAPAGGGAKAKKDSAAMDALAAATERARAAVERLKAAMDEGKALRASLYPAEALRQETERLGELFRLHAISAQEYADGVQRAKEQIYGLASAQQLAAQEAARLDASMQEGHALKAQFDPMIVYQDHLAKLSTLLQDGAIDQLTFNKSLTEARVAMYQTTGMGQLTTLAFESVGKAVAESARGVLQGTQTMSQAFKNMEDAIVTSILDGIIQNGLDALKKAFLDTSSSPGGFNWGGLVGSLFSAWGGGAAAAAPAALGPVSSLNGMMGHTAMGGVFQTPQLRSISEHGAEAVVPLPGGRKIPVDLKGAGMTQQRSPVVINMNINTPNVQGFRASEGQVSSMVARMVNRATADG